MLPAAAEKAVRKTASDKALRYTDCTKEVRADDICTMKMRAVFWGSSGAARRRLTFFVRFLKVLQKSGDLINGPYF